MVTIASLIDKAQTSNQKLQASILSEAQNRKTAVELWRQACTDIEPQFDIDKADRPLLNSLLGWTWRYDPWNVLGFDYDKGFLFIGTIGRGKSLTIKILRRYHALLYSWKRSLHDSDNRLGMRYATAAAIVGAFVDDGENGLQEYTDPHNNIIIDELGREPAVGSHYGTRLDVMQYLLQTRYDHRRTCVTHATTNSSVADIEQRYGDFIADRFKEIFNIYVFADGDSLRQ